MVQSIPFGGHSSIPRLLLLLLVAYALLANIATAALLGPFKIQASSPRTRVDGQYVQAIVTEGTFYGWVLRDSGSNFSLDTSTGLLSAKVDDRYLDKNVAVFAYGRYDGQTYRGEARLTTKARMADFNNQAWKCTLDGTRLKCSGAYGGNFYVCSEYDWTFLRSAKPDLGCENIQFRIVQ